MACSLEADFARSFPNSKIRGIFEDIIEGIHDLNHSLGPLAIVCHEPLHFTAVETTWRAWQNRCWFIIPFNRAQKITQL